VVLPFAARFRNGSISQLTRRDESVVQYELGVPVIVSAYHQEDRRDAAIEHTPPQVSGRSVVSLAVDGL